MRCFYCENIEVGELPESALDKRERDHLFKVLRGRPGDRISLIDGRGGISEAVVTEDSGIRVESLERLPEPRVKTYLFVAPPRRRRMDEMLSQCSELGVWRVAPLLTERSVSTPTGEGAVERMRIRLIEGCKQARNPFLPELLEPMDFSNALSVAADSCPFIFYGSREREGWGDVSVSGRDVQGASLDVAWFVGPEGGFSDSELNALRDAGARPLNLGDWTLRVETAAVAGIAVLNREFRGLPS